MFKDIVKCTKGLLGQIQPHFVKSFLRVFFFFAEFDASYIFPFFLPVLTK